MAYSEHDGEVTLTCINCGRKYAAEGYDPLGGDCPVVRTADGTIIAAEGEYPSLEAFKAARTRMESNEL